MRPTPEVSLPSGFIRAISAASTQDEMLNVTASWLPRIIAVERASIALPLSSTDMAIYAFGGQIQVTRTERKLATSKSLVGHAFSDRAVIVVDDITKSSYSDLGPLIEAGLRSAMTAPLARGSECLGTVNLASRHVGFFTDTHRELLGAIGELIAGSLNLAQLAAREKTRAMTDDLTGCLNRGAVLAELDVQDRRSRHGVDKAGPSLLYIDLNGFKLVNDIHGNRIGDQVLQILADRIRSKLTPGETLGRIAGDEFLIVVSDDPLGARARRVAENVLAVSDDPIVIRRMRIPISLSIGVASPHANATSSGVTSAEQLLTDADWAMDRAKHRGGGVFAADEEIRRRTAMLAAIDRDLEGGLVDGSIQFHYQPVCQLSDGQITGAEALIRWKHAEFGPIPPPLLIDRIEATGRVSSFTRWCIDRAARDLTLMRDAEPRFARGRISFNLSPLQLALSDCSDMVLATFQKYGIDPKFMPVEVVESSAINPGDQAERTIQALSDAGCIIALDDFGTGHNALGYFTRFPIHIIKFDRSLVGVMTTSDEARKILKALASMSNDLGIYSLAEGIEHQDEMDACRELGVTYGQGWHLGRPKPLDEMIALLQQQPAATAR